MNLLGLETSCDETAAAVIDGDGRILSQTIFSQIDVHRVFGGVVPEIASRAHLEKIRPIIAQAFETAGIGFGELDAVAAAGGPGLIGGVIVGVMTAKAIALARDIPFIAVNHLEGHALSPRIENDIAFPYLLVLVSGGHCQMLMVDGIGKYRLLGQTLDDAIGETFDKVAAMLGLPYPGGPEIEKLAMHGNPHKIRFPRPLLGKPGCDFSLSGLKTAVRMFLEKRTENISVEDICASFQQSVIDCIIDRTGNALAATKAKRFIVAGGVAANREINLSLKNLADRTQAQFYAPSLKLCTDNAAMIAYAGLLRYRMKSFDKLDFKPRPRWDLWMD